MYYILNQTQKNFITHKGDWPEEHLQDLLKKGDKIIVISTYSNTIKVPVKFSTLGVDYWESFHELSDIVYDEESEYCWMEFKIPTEVIYNVYYDMLNKNF